jgi:hypothetical protein
MPADILTSSGTQGRTALLLCVKRNVENCTGYPTSACLGRELHCVASLVPQKFLLFRYAVSWHNWSQDGGMGKLARFVNPRALGGLRNDLHSEWDFVQIPLLAAARVCAGKLLPDGGH